MNDDEDDDQKDVLTLACITHQEWAIIKGLAVKYLQSGKYGSDQTKCAVAGFADWIASQERDFVVDIIDPFRIH